MDSLPTKVCGTCKVEKYRYEFYNSYKAWDGLYASCRECTKKCTDKNKKNNKPPSYKDYPYPP